MDVTQLKLALRSGDLIILEHWIRLAERQLRNGRIFGSGLEALCIAVAKARGTLVLEVHSVARVKIDATRLQVLTLPIGRNTCKSNLGGTL